MGWGMKDFSNGPGHMTNMAAMSIYGINLNTSSSDDLGNGYAASGPLELPSLFN